MAVNTTPHTHTLIMCSNVFIRKDGKYLMLRRSDEKEFSPGFFHTVGGKVDPDEDPYTAAAREAEEETGFTIKNIKLEAVTSEILPIPGRNENWLGFYFSADYDSGDLRPTDEGELILIDETEIINQKLIPSIRAVLPHILNPHDGVVFLNMSYDKDGKSIPEKTVLNICTT